MIKQTGVIYVAILVLWSLYRYLFKLPLYLEETLIKGLVFASPIFLFPIKGVKSKLVSLGITTKTFFRSVYFGIMAGMILGFAGQIGNIIRHGQITFNSYGLSPANIGYFLIFSLITAFWEQLLFAGYFLAKIKPVIKDEVSQTLIIGSAFALIHLPALLFVQHLDPAQLLLSFFLLLSLGVSCVILRLRFNNLIAPIMVHALWGITIYLFR